MTYEIQLTYGRQGSYCTEVDAPTPSAAIEAARKEVSSYRGAFRALIRGTDRHWYTLPQFLRVSK